MPASGLPFDDIRALLPLMPEASDRAADAVRARQAQLTKPAGSLGRLDEIGTLERGKRCDMAIWDVDDPAELVYRIGFNPLHARVWGGT